ncbi:hypothetical protein NDS46_30365 (plasmid) [Paenibacillus thiaminolyticus]|uniref:hypothetical protein n=1 Tax=Paenibacillus thiaminolyticus TaxID=49283 RepID=UPI00232CBB34|nr:hypothetical protein [Paenibacillus thiaminolyticus]WCF11653.1 hypothetical protein NDS46_30365 [Paenibacillus thiaminolyticus]
MDIRTQFYLNCLKNQAGLSQKKFPTSNLKNSKVTLSDEYKSILNSGGIYIEEGQLENTWVAIYEDHWENEVELIFDVQPTESSVRFVEFIFSIEEYLSKQRIKPFVDVNGVTTHWTLLPCETPEEKWEQYILLRDKQEVRKQKKTNQETT